MALHISGKLCALGLVIASLITAFSLPTVKNTPVDVTITPVVSTIVMEAQDIQDLASEPLGPNAGLSFTLRATGYNSEVNQTDSTPHITATGTTTRFGIIAVSRDLLNQDIPYGSLVRIVDKGNYYNGRGAGQFQQLLDEQTLFIVEDTMHPRKRQQIDVWFPHMSTALDWGVRQVEVEVVRYGHDGPEIAQATTLADAGFSTGSSN